MVRSKGATGYVVAGPPACASNSSSTETTRIHWAATSNIARIGTAFPATPTSAGGEPQVTTAKVARPGGGGLAFVMGGGGARAAYQVGVLRGIARQFPEVRAPIVTGVSAGAINAAMLAAHHGTFAQAADELHHLWSELTPERVFRTDLGSLAKHAAAWAWQLASGGVRTGPRVRGLVDTAPLRSYLAEALHAIDGELTGIRANLATGRLRAAAISTTNYSTGQSVLWVQGQDVQAWERPKRRSVVATLSVEHVMASASLPILFPAVRIGPHWFGDGGIRLTAPLSPALHLGADRILAVSTRRAHERRDAALEMVTGYPPLAQVAGLLMNSVFLDVLDQDAQRLDLVNKLLEQVDPEARQGLRPVRLVTLRPSVDLGRLADEYEPQLPKMFRFMTRGLGTKQVKTSDFLSLVMFQPDYLQELIKVGEADAEAHAGEIAEILSRPRQRSEP